MSRIINPMDALKSFEPALMRGELSVEPGRTNAEVFVHQDFPNGEVRYSYGKMRGAFVGALAIIVPAQAVGSIHAFQIGYAVPQHLRKRGLAKEITKAAIDEFTFGMARHGVKCFYIEAIVGVKNVASQYVAAHVIGGEPKRTYDNESGEPAFQYLKLIEIAA